MKLGPIHYAIFYMSMTRFQYINIAAKKFVIAYDIKKVKKVK